MYRQTVKKYDSFNRSLLIHNQQSHKMVISSFLNKKDDFILYRVLKLNRLLNLKYQQTYYFSIFKRVKFIFKRTLNIFKKILNAFSQNMILKNIICVYLFFVFAWQHLIFQNLINRKNIYYSPALFCKNIKKHPFTYLEEKKCLFGEVLFKRFS